MRRIALAAAALVCAAALTGCVSQTNSTAGASSRPTHSKTPIPSIPPTPSITEKQLDTAATSDVGIAAYSIGGYNTVADSGFAHAGSTGDAFPKGTWVAVFRLSVTGNKMFGKADLTGLNYTGSTWNDAATEQAVFDDKGGAAYADKLGLPYGAAAVLGSSPWKVDNGKTNTYAIAVYMPVGASTLTLQVNILSQSVPMKLRLPVGGE